MPRLVAEALAEVAALPGTATGRTPATAHDVVNDGHDALIALGHSPADAREKIEQALRSHGKFKSVDELIQAIYKNERKTG